MLLFKTVTVARYPGSGIPQTAYNAEIVELVDDLKLSQEGAPLAHHSVPEFSRTVTSSVISS